MEQGARYMIFATFCFALMNVMIKYMQYIPAYEIVFFRSIVSFILCYIGIKKKGISPWGNNKKILILRGLFGSVALLMFFYTLHHMPLASAVTIQYLSPIFTALFAIVILGERLPFANALFFLVSFCGVILIKGFDERIELITLLAGISAAIFSGLAYNMIRKLSGKDDPLVIIFYFPLVTLPLISPYTFTHWVMPLGWDWLWLLAIGVLTQIAQYFMTRAYQLEKAGKIANYMYLGTVFALIFGFIFFGETFRIMSIAGMGLVIIGVLLNIFYKEKLKSTV